ncbi:hypothetical protein BC831DRAFT_516285 [Entophlyctis helioformis]|nr:hypothetical protein BC831DRAFT_516285 [Entophlyctis helioformis]
MPQPTQTAAPPATGLVADLLKEFDPLAPVAAASAPAASAPAAPATAASPAPAEGALSSPDFAAGGEQAQLGLHDKQAGDDGTEAARRGERRGSARGSFMADMAVLASASAAPTACSETLAAQAPPDALATPTAPAPSTAAATTTATAAASAVDTSLSAAPAAEPAAASAPTATTSESHARGISTGIPTSAAAAAAGTSFAAPSPLRPILVDTLQHQPPSQPHLLDLSISSLEDKAADQHAPTAKSDGEAAKEELQDDGTFHRIVGIVDQLLREANDALTLEPDEVELAMRDSDEDSVTHQLDICMNSPHAAVRPLRSMPAMRSPLSTSSLRNYSPQQHYQQQQQQYAYSHNLGRGDQQPFDAAFDHEYANDFSNPAAFQLDSPINRRSSPLSSARSSSMRNARSSYQLRSPLPLYPHPQQPVFHHDGIRPLTPGTPAGMGESRLWTTTSLHEDAEEDVDQNDDLHASGGYPSAANRRSSMHNSSLPIRQMQSLQHLQMSGQAGSRINSRGSRASFGSLGSRHSMSSLKAAALGVTPIAPLPMSARVMTSPRAVGATDAHSDADDDMSSVSSISPHSPHSPLPSADLDINHHTSILAMRAVPATTHTGDVADAPAAVPMSVVPAPMAASANIKVLDWLARNVDEEEASLVSSAVVVSRRSAASKPQQQPYLAANTDLQEPFINESSTVEFQAIFKGFDISQSILLLLHIQTSFIILFTTSCWSIFVSFVSESADIINLIVDEAKGDTEDIIFVSGRQDAEYAQTLMEEQQQKQQKQKQSRAGIQRFFEHFDDVLVSDDDDDDGVFGHGLL